jgi:hypothetical protein
MPLLENVYKGGTPVDRVYRGTSLAWQRVVDPPPADPSWQEAWDTRDFTTIRNWYRANTGIEWAIKTNELSSWDDLTETGSLNTTSNGQVIENRLFSGTVEVWHDNVTIQNCAWNTQGGAHAVRVPFGALGTVLTLTLRNLTIQGYPDDGTRPPPYMAPPAEFAPAIMAVYTGSGGGLGLQASRVRINGYGGGFRLNHFGNNPERVEYSMVENIRTHTGDDPPATSSHNTAFNFRGGAGKSTFRSWYEGSSSNAVSTYNDQALAITDFTIEECLLDAYYHYAINCGGDPPFYGLNNLFTKNYQASTPIQAWPGGVWSGNFHLDGTPV